MRGSHEQNRAMFGHSPSTTRMHLAKERVLQQRHYPEEAIILPAHHRIELLRGLWVGGTLGCRRLLRLQLCCFGHAHSSNPVVVVVPAPGQRVFISGRPGKSTEVGLDWTRDCAPVGGWDVGASYSDKKRFTSPPEVGCEVASWLLLVCLCE